MLASNKLPFSFLFKKTFQRSPLLHIKEILVHWSFLEKWVVKATFILFYLALKQNFLAGTLIKN